MIFASGSDAVAELMLDQLIVSLATADRKTADRADVLPGRDRPFISFTVRLPRVKGKRARCLTELGFDLAGQEVAWP